MRFFPLRPVAVVLACSIFAVSTGGIRCSAQDRAASDREAQIAERFLDVLLRRPRPGTALDRVYGYHVQAGTLDQLIEDLESDDAEAGGEAGARAMLRGLLLLRRGSDAEAAESLTEADRVRTDDAMASYYLGKALLQIGKADPAAEALQRAIDRKPARNEALPVFTELGRLYQRARQPKKALEVWNRLEATFPGDSRVGEQIASTLADEGQEEAALDRYERLAEEAGPADDPRVIGYRTAAAEMKRRLGRTDEALTDFESIASRLRPASWLYTDVRRRIEAVFLRGGDYSALADYYAERVEQHPDELALRLRLGQSLAKAGRINEAETSLRETVRRAPDDVDARLALIDVLKTAAKAEEAAAQFERLVEQDPENPDYLVQLGNAWLDASDVKQETRQDRAAEAWNRLAEARFDDPVMTAQVGDLMRRIGRDDEALELYRRAVELAPEQPQYREYLGEFLHRLDRHDEAIEVWAAIAEPPRDNRENLVRLAEVFHTFDEPERGLEAFRRAAELDPTFAQRLRFADLLARSQRYDEALAQLDRSDEMAETPEEREQVLRARIGVYAGSGTLDEQIAEAERQAEESGASDDYRRLALMFDAAARLSDATAAIESAIEADSDDTSALAVAAELYRKGARLGDAVEVYRSLAERDPRFLPNYLKRIAGLQMRLGQIDKALATASELIDAQPGNPDSYRLYADQCFQVGRDDEGIETLRRALRAAPRDRDTRQALAGALARQFQTDEAIEIYWELLDDAGDLDDEKRWVGMLAPLYEQQGDFERLISRLELRGRESSQTRSSVVLRSAAHRAVNDFGSARQTLEPLLVESPRDPELLNELVTLAEVSSEPELALEYQERLVSLADTPENRNRLLSLMVDSGQIEQAEASLQRFRAIDDPVTMIELVDRTIGRGDTDAAVRFCRATLDQHRDLWEVRARLAALLVVAGETEEALEQAARVESLELAGDTSSEMSKSSQSRKRQPTATSNTTNSLQRIYSSSRLNQTQQVYRLGQLFRVGRYASLNYSVSSRGGSPVKVSNVREAKFLALATRLAVAAKEGDLDEVAGSIVDDSEWETTQDADTLWDAMQVKTIATAFSPDQSNRGVFGSEEQDTMKWMWRIAEVDESERDMIVYRLLQQRMMRRNPPAQLRGNVDIEPPEPLDESRLDLVRGAYEGGGQLMTGQQGGMIAAAVHDELVAAGKTSEAEAFRERFERTPESPDDAINAFAFFVAARQSDEVARLMQQIRDSIPKWAESMTTAEITRFDSVLHGVFSMEEIPAETKSDAIDLAIATQAIKQLRSVTRRRASPGRGELSVGYQVDGRYQRNQISVPFSDRLLASSFVQQLYVGTRFGDDSPERDRLLRHLSEDVNLFPAGSQYADTEQKLRTTLAAFAQWWAGDLPAAYDRITAATARHPDDHDLWIEHARMAAELNRPQAALEALDAIEPLDQATLRVRELAAMNLATRLGRLERAKTAAQRLFGMRLDPATEMALADQLNRLGMQDMAKAILQRSQRRGGQSISDLLQLAQRFLDAGESEAAAEVAYRTLRQAGGQSVSNSDYYRRQAVQLLQQVGRLDKLLAQAERRVGAAPNSPDLKTELAELYTAAGRRDDAEKLFEQIAELQPNDPKTLWEMAKRLNAAGKHDEAVDKFIAAIEKDPQLLHREYHQFERAVSSAKASDKAYRLLTKIDISQLPSHYLGQMVRLYRRESSEPSEAAVAFLDHVLETAPLDSLGGVLRTVGYELQLAKSDSVANAVRRILSSDSVFQPGSRFWQGNSYSSGGNLRGPLEPCLRAVRAHDGLAEFTRQRLEELAGDDDTKRLANVLLLAVEIDSLEPDEAEGRIEQLVEGEEREVPYQVWWQLGQVLEEKPGFEPLAVIALEHALSIQDSVMTSGYQYSIEAKLADVYLAAGQKEKARQELLRGYEATDNSEQNQFNPGYGDYQDLQSYQAIAEKLVKVDARLDAIRIYSDALAEPARFERAKRWGGSTDYASRFEQGLSKSIDALEDADFDRFLSLEDRDPAETETGADGKTGADGEEKAAAKQDTDGETGGDESARPRFDLIPLATSLETPPERTSVAALVVTKSAESEDGRERLRRFEEELGRRRETFPDDRSLLAMETLVHVALERDAAAATLGRLAESIPGDPEDLGQSERRTILSYYSPVSVALGSDASEVRAEAGRLADVLVEIANHDERTEISGFLLTAKFRSGDSDDPGAASAAMRMMLDNVAPPVETPAVVTVDTARNCLRVAETAGEAGAWDVVAEALRRGFGGGPPLRNLTEAAAGGSAFVIPTQSRSVGSSGNRPVENLDWVARRVAAIVEASQKAEDQAAANQVYAALKGAVLPEVRPDEAFPYAVDLLTSSNTSSFSKPDMHPASLSRLLAVSAVASDKTAEFRELLDERRSKTGATYQVDLMRVHLAVAEDEEDAADRALRDLGNRLGVAMPLDESDPAVLAPAGEKDPSGPGDAKTTVNEVLHAVLPVHDRWGVTPVVAAIETHLLGEASQVKPISDAGAIWGWIVRQVLEEPGIDEPLAKQAMDRYLASVRLHYSNYSGSYGIDRYNAELASLGGSATKGKLWTMSGGLLRQGVRRDPGFQPHGDSISKLAMGMANVEAEKRFSLLSRIIFGDSDEEPLVRSSNLVLYVDPPEAFSSLFAARTSPREIPVASDDLPIVGLSLMIAEAAAECGKTDALVRRLKPRQESPGDEVDAMIGLALLADGRADEAKGSLERVVGRLTETMPTKSVDTPMPVVSAMFAARSLSHETLRDTAVSAWEPLLDHSRRRSISLAGSVFSRATVGAGWTAAAGATAGSPLKHFVSVQLPYIHKPVAPMTEPIYVMRDGSLHFTGGSGQNALMLKYPLAGDFAFSHRNIRRGWGESHNQFGGTAYLAKPHNSTLTVRGLVTRSSVVLDQNATHMDNDNTHAVVVAGDRVMINANGKELAVDRRTSSMPFVGVHFEFHTISEAADIRLEGSPTIPRQVDLIDEDLRGWSCPIIGGSLIPMALPLKPDQDPDLTKAQRQQNLENAERFTWFGRDGELRSGNRGVSPAAAGQRHIQYMRPLLDGETIRYEFFHEAGKRETHPSLGRIGVLLRPDGVKLRWLPQRDSLESAELDPLHGVDPDELLGDGKPELRPNDWNDVELTAEGDDVLVRVNGKPVARFATSLDRRFGLLGEADRECRVRSIRLTGDWPKTLPEDLLEATE